MLYIQVLSKTAYFLVKHILRKVCWHYMHTEHCSITSTWTPSSSSLTRHSVSEMMARLLLQQYQTFWCSNPLCGCKTWGRAVCSSYMMLFWQNNSMEYELQHTKGFLQQISPLMLFAAAAAINHIIQVIQPHLCGDPHLPVFIFSFLFSAAFSWMILTAFLVAAADWVASPVALTVGHLASLLATAAS